MKDVYFLYLKLIKKNITLILFAIINITTNNLFAQDLSKLSEADRNKKLIETAKEVYKAPRLKNFYREYGIPTIAEMRTKNPSRVEHNKISNDTNSILNDSSDNQKFYIVYFPYDRNKERFEENYAAKVYIWENTGKAFSIGLGNMIMFDVRNGKIPDHNKIPEPEKYYTLTYSKDVPNAAALPKIGKEGDVITIELKTITTEDNHGRITENGYRFNAVYDVTEGEIMSDSIKYPVRIEQVRTIQLMVTGNMKVNITKYQVVYSAPFQ